MNSDELEEAARQSGSTDLSGPDEISGPPIWLAVFVFCGLVVCALILWMVFKGLVFEYISIHNTMTAIF